jgi:PAS domain S-box-containing protein
MRGLLEMEKSLGRIGPGDHVMVLHDSVEERAQLIAVLIKGGIDHEERCVHESEVDLKERIFHHLARMGIDGQVAESEGTLLFIQGFESRMHSEKEVVKVVEEIEAMARSARSDGYKGLRLIGGLKSDAAIRGHTREYLEYESRLSSALDEMPATVICLYALRDFYPGLLSWVMKEHSLVVVNGRVCDNLFHTAAESAIKPTSSKKELDRMLGLLLSAEMQKQDLIVQSEELRQLNEQLTVEVERRRSFELALLESQGNLRSLIDSMADAIYVVDQERHIVLINQAFEDMAESMGLESPFLGRLLYECIPYAVSNSALLDEAFSTGRTILHEGTHRYAGHTMHAETRFVPVRRGASIGQVLIITRNITDRRLKEIGEEERERQLQVVVDEKTKELDQERENRLRETIKRQELEARTAFVNELLDTIDDMVIVTDHRGAITYMNQTALAFFGYTLAEVAGTSVGALVPPPYDEKGLNRILEALAGGEEVNWKVKVLAKDGRTEPMQARVKMVGSNGAGMFIGTLRSVR